jgi:hypothetical protein
VGAAEQAAVAEYPCDFAFAGWSFGGACYPAL